MMVGRLIYRTEVQIPNGTVGIENQGVRKRLGKN
jgi:hypothetical protein